MDDSAVEQNKDEFEVKNEKKSWSEQKAGQSCRKNGEAGQSRKLGRAKRKGEKLVNTEDSEDSEAAREEVESPTNREKIEESQKFKGRIPSINLATNNFEEAETGTKMADNLDHRKMTIEVSKDSELGKKMELIKKMMPNWKETLIQEGIEELEKKTELVGKMINDWKETLIPEGIEGRKKEELI